MNKYTTLIITNKSKYWHALKPYFYPNNHVIIDTDKITLSKLHSINKIDYLVLHNIPSTAHFFLIKRIASHVSINSIFVLPPDYSEAQVVDGIKMLEESKKNVKCHASPDWEYGFQNRGRGASECNHQHTDYKKLHLNGFMLGSFTVLVNDMSIHEWRGKKAKSLLAYLLYNRRFANSREIIMDKFWPNVSPQAARNSLNGIIHKIRRLLKCIDPGRDYILFKNDRYLFNPELSIKLDYEKFLESFNTAQTLERQQSITRAIPYYEEATRLYKGDFLEEDRYEEWTYSERESFKQKYLHAMDRLSYHYLTCEKYLLAQQYCRKMLAKDDCLEEIHRRLMICLHKNGYRDLAVKQFYICAKSLEKGLDIKPGQTTIDLLNDIKNN